MNDRHKKLGIKQTIQKHWMDHVVKMMIAGLSENDIRSELKCYLSTQKQSGGFGKRGEVSYSMAIGPLASWFDPCAELVTFRDRALSLIRNVESENWLPFHWAVLSASYPFWFQVAKHTGRLLNLQERITQAQVFSRLREKFGDRETVARNARYAIRSFVAWGVLQDTETRGCYEQKRRFEITNPNLEVLLYEAALHAEQDGKSDIRSITNCPAFFPFRLSTLSSETISRMGTGIDALRLGQDDELLLLQEKYNIICEETQSVDLKI